VVIVGDEREINNDRRGNEIVDIGTRVGRAPTTPAIARRNMLSSFLLSTTMSIAPPDSTRKAVRERTRIVSSSLSSAAAASSSSSSASARTTVAATPLARRSAAVSTPVAANRVAELEKTNAELLKFQDEARSLYALATAHEAERSQLRRSLDAQTHAAENAARELAAANVRANQRITDLSEKLAAADARVAELNAARRLLLADLDAETAARSEDARRRAADRTVEDLRVALDDANRAAAANTVRLEQERSAALAQLRASEANVRAKLDASEKRAAAHCERAEKLAAELAVARASPALATIDDAAAAAAAQTNSDAARVMAAEMTRLRTELAEVRRAHRSMLASTRGENGLILQQRVDELEQRLTQRDLVVAEQVEQLAALEEQQATHAADSRLLASEGGVSGALARLGALRRDNETLLARCLSLETAARRSEASRAESDALLADTQQRLEASEARLHEAALLSERAERSVAIARAERNGLQQLVQTYANAEVLDAAQIVTDLQQQLANATAQATELENALLDAAERTALGNESRKRARHDFDETIDNDNDGNDSPSRVLASRPSLNALPCPVCVRRANEAEAQSAAGAYDHGEMQAIHLKVNPFSVARQRFLDQQQQQQQQEQREPASVSHENAALRTPARPVGAGGSQQTPFSAAVTPGADADKRILRLKEVFKERIGEFREAVHVLFGYRIDMSDQRCRLLSQYSSSPKDVLLFDLKRNERGVLGVELLENAYSKSLGPELTNYLYKLHSMPAFVANHTIELFSAQTFTGANTTALLSEQQ
jgi:hypothetical protein